MSGSASGREERIMEKPYIDMPVMLDDLEEAVREVVDGPYALWGHSMGGKIAYELEKRLEAVGYTASCLFISGSRIPVFRSRIRSIIFQDEEFKRNWEDLRGRKRDTGESGIIGFLSAYATGRFYHG